MSYLTLFIVIAGAADHSYEVMRHPVAFDLRKTTVCGAIRRMQSSGIPFILEADGSKGRKGILVDPQLVQSENVGSGENICIDGVVRRVDGLTEKQAVAAGRTFALEDTSYDAAYYLKAK